MMKTSLSNSILILGSDGFIGSALFNYLKGNENYSVFGTKKEEDNSDFLYLDTSNKESVERFPWARFRTIVDCTGNIDYRNTCGAFLRNTELNVMGPLRILEHLNEHHHYWYLSTHALQMSKNKFNSYLHSKASFENIFRTLETRSKITILRIPGIFDLNRKNGLLHNIKTAYQTESELNIDFNGEFWHCMHLPRLVEIMDACIQKSDERMINIGYKTETSLVTILDVAEKMTGRKIGNNVGLNAIDYYRPDVEIQNKYIDLPKDAFVTDLKEYFSVKQ